MKRICRHSRPECGRDTPVGDERLQRGVWRAEPANEYLLTEMLRKAWGFKGAVVGDVDTVGDMVGAHRYAKDGAEASAEALLAGNDECSGHTYAALHESLKRGLVKDADLDRALRRLLTLRVQARHV